MKREWKPGDVVLDPDYGVAVVVAPHSSGCPAHHLERGLHIHYGDGDWNPLVDRLRPFVVIDPETVLPVGWTADNVPALLEACAQIVAESTAPREVHETTLLLNLVRAFDEALGTGLSEPTDPAARVTDRRDNIWRLLADGEWVCVDGPDVGEYLTWSRLTERGPMEVRA